ncbi:MAG: CobW family GTP-binding protein [Acidimicrobiales bacterium]
MIEPADALIDGFRTITATLSVAASNAEPPLTEAETAIPVTVLTGFLGSGKTTVLRRLLAGDHGVRLTALVNDLAAINVDAQALTDTGGVANFGLSSGCACCQLGDQLTESLQNAAEAEPRPEAIAIEASGGADVVAMAAAVEAEQGLSLDGVVCMVDASAWSVQLAHPVLGHLVRRQLETAHLVLLTKVDLVDSATVNSIVAKVGQLVPGRQVVATADGVVDPSVVLGAALRGATFRPATEPHQQILCTRSVELSGPIEMTKLAQWLEADQHGLLRVKGWIRSEDGAHHELQVVGRRWTLTASDGHQPTALVVIADAQHKVNQAAEALLACRADYSAVTTNE